MTKTKKNNKSHILTIIFQGPYTFIFKQLSLSSTQMSSKSMLFNFKKNINLVFMRLCQ